MKIKILNIGACIYSPGFWDSDAGEFKVKGQPGLHNKPYSNKQRRRQWNSFSTRFKMELKP